MKSCQKTGKLGPKKLSKTGKLGQKIVVKGTKTWTENGWVRQKQENLDRNSGQKRNGRLWKTGNSDRIWGNHQNCPSVFTCSTCVVVLEFCNCCVVVLEFCNCCVVVLEFCNCIALLYWSFATTEWWVLVPSSAIYFSFSIEFRLKLTG